MTQVMINSTDIDGLSSPVEFPNPTCKVIMGGSTFEGDAVWLGCDQANQYGGVAERRLQNDFSKRRLDSEQCLFCFTPEVSNDGTASLYASLSGAYSSEDTSAQFTYYTQPTITELVPKLGPASGGTPIQVYGENFKDVSTYCAFGSTKTVAQYVSSTNLICYSPESSVVDSFVLLEVTLNNQQYTLGNTRYYYYEDPEITNAYPAVSPLSGGINVTICGDFLYPFYGLGYSVDPTDYFIVRFGDVWVNGTLQNETCFFTTAPSQSSVGFVDVSITFNELDFSTGAEIFYYYYVPGVSGIQNRDASGVIPGSPDSIDIYGGPFDPSENYTCSYGDEVVEGEYINSTTIECPVPDDVKESGDSYPFSVGEDGNYTTPIDIKFSANPNIDSISPPCGYASGNTLVTIKGSSFSSIGENILTCVFNESLSSPGLVYDDSTVYCSNPPLSSNADLPSEVSLSLKFSNGASVSANNLFYTYMSDPEVVTVTPSYGALDGGNVIKLYLDLQGKYSTCGTEVKFGTHYGTMMSSYSDQGAIRVVVPKASYEDDVIPHVTLNGQDFVPASKGVFYSYIKYPETKIFSPEFGSNAGGFDVTIIGEGFDLDRQGGLASANYTCAFYTSEDTKPFAEVPVTSWTPFEVQCVAPAASDQSSIDVALQLDGEICQILGNNTIVLIETSLVESVSPSFAEVSNQEEISRITLSGSGLSCLTSQNCAPQCSFTLTTDSSVIFYTVGFTESSTTAYCEIPYVPVSSKYFVNFATDGVAFTTSKVEFSYFSPFVLSLNPNYIDISGSSLLTVLSGLGFFETTDLKYQLSSTDSSTTVMCSGEDCVFTNIKYVNETALEIVSLPSYSQISFTKEPPNPYVFNLWVSFDGGDTFTTNQLLLTYYSSPSSSGSSSGISGQVSSENKGTSLSAIYPQTLGSVTISTVWNDATDPTSFSAQCIMSGEYQKYTTSAIVIPTENSGEYIYLCDTSKVIESALDGTSETILSYLNQIQPGNYDFSLSLSGAGSLSQGIITIMTPPTISKISPFCSNLPSKGSSMTFDLTIDGDMETDLGSWSLLIFDQEYPLTQSSDLQTWSFTQEGSDNSDYVFTRDKGAFFLKYTRETGVPVVIFVQSVFQFQEYVQPEIIRLTPSSSMASDSSWVAIEGTYFYKITGTECTWKVKFNDTISEAVETLSPERIIALIPSGSSKTSTFYQVYISLDGENWYGGLDLYIYAQLDLISLSPAYGSSLGGTVIYIESNGLLEASSLTLNMLCSFQDVTDKSVPTVYTNAFISNSTTIVCQSPTGFADGVLFKVEVSLNGVDFSNSGLEFAMYATYGASPLAGPASGGFDLVVSGNGFQIAANAVGKSDVACKIGNEVIVASSYNETAIVCLVPQSPGGSNYYGQESISFTFDGEVFNDLGSSLIYFEDPIVSSYSPSSLPMSGGTIYLYGSAFRTEMIDDTDAICLYNGIDEGTLSFISTEEISCTFDSISSDESGDGSGLKIFGDGIYFDIGSLDITVSLYGVSKIFPTSTPYNFATSVSSHLPIAFRFPAHFKE